MEVCFHGPLRLIQAALPGLRNRQSGMIINISSVAALDSLPACGLYSASKWAIEGQFSTLVD
jgi:NADP-dependent 3-hydroxy acid dehydrogenase YdfG